MHYFNIALLLIYTVLILGTTLKILLENRQPEKTLAWLLVLTFLPVAGVIIYYFFGQNLRRQRLISRRSMSQLMIKSMTGDEPDTLWHIPEEYKSLAHLFQQVNHAVPYSRYQTQIYTHGYDFFASLITSLGRARHHIHIITYIIEDDPLGRLITDILIDKARSGVEVRLIYDDVGCWQVPSAFFDRMHEGGIEVRPFMPVRFPRLTGKINYRNHRKIIVIDGSTGFIGGMNIAMRYLRGTYGIHWRDTHLRITGSPVHGLQRAFLTDWYFVDRTLISDPRYYPDIPATGTPEHVAQVVTASPASPMPEIMHGLERIILQARRYIYIETPYFLPTETILFALQTAALSGVDVRIMLPWRADSRLTEWSSKSYMRHLWEAGITVCFYMRGFNHSKMIVSDDRICSCGSTNMDFRSFENNFEANIFFYDPPLARQMKTIFEQDQRDCRIVRDPAVYRRLPLSIRLRDSLVRLLAPLL